MISDCKSNDGSADVENEGEDVMEADVFQIGQGCLDEVEFVSQDAGDPGNLAVRLFEAEDKA